MLAFRKAITCLKRSSKATVAFVQRLGLKLEFGKSEARAWELHQTLCEFVGEIGWNFLCVFALCCWKRNLLDFLGFCVDILLMLRTLLLEVSSVFPFCVRE